MEIAEQISVFLDDCPSDFATATALMADNKIDFQTVNVAETPDFWELRFICDQPEKAQRILTKAGFKLASHEVVLVEAANKLGSVAAIAKTLAAEEIDFEYLYSTGGKKENWKDYLLLIATSEPKKALACLKKALK